MNYDQVILAKNFQISFNKNIMLIILITILELFLGFLLFDKNITSEEYSIFCIIFSSIIVLYYVYNNFSKYQTILFIAYGLRIFLLFVDYYNIFPIIHSGKDTEAFHRIATHNAFLEEIDVKRTNYVTILSYIYFVIGPQRLFAQYINVLCGMGTIFFIIKSLEFLTLENRTKTIFIVIACIFPHFIIFSGILLRESILIFATSISVYLFIKWFVKGNIINLMLSCIVILLAVWLHSGMVGLLLGYFIAYSLYDKRTQKIKIKFTSIMTIGISCVLFYLIIYSGFFTDYFDGIINSEDEVEALMDIFNHESKGESRYLAWINVDNPFQMVVFSPIRMLYFLFSPIPFDWRGLNDIIAFCLNSLLILYLTWTSIANFKYINNTSDKNFVKILYIALFFTILIHSYGTYTSGVAMRHRTKIVSLLIVTAAISYNSKKQYNLSSSYNEKNIINF